MCKTSTYSVLLCLFVSVALRRLRATKALLPANHESKSEHRDLLSSLHTVEPSLFYCHSPEDTFCLVTIETQNLLREASLHPGKLAVWIPLLLKRHHLLQRGAEHGGTEDGVPGMFDLLQTWLLQTLNRDTQRS